MEDYKKIEALVSKITNLPTLPVVVTRLTGLLGDPEANIRDVTSLLSEDQALTAKILRLANSSFYGFPGEIGTIRQAVVVLGFAAIRDIALSASLFDVFQEESTSPRGSFNMYRFWEHSIGVAVMSRVLADHLKAEKPEEVFVAGLLHDVGKVVLQHYLPAEFEKVMERINSLDCAYLDAEGETGVTHAGIGRFLAEKWNLPASIIEPVGFHHSVRFNRATSTISAIVHVADILVRANGVGSSGDTRLPALNPQAWELLKLDFQILPELFQKFDEGILRAEVFLEMVKSRG